MAVADPDPDDFYGADSEPEEAPVVPGPRRDSFFGLRPATPSAQDATPLKTDRLSKLHIPSRPPSTGLAQSSDGLDNVPPAQSTEKRAVRSSFFGLQPDEPPSLARTRSISGPSGTSQPRELLDQPASFYASDGAMQPPRSQSTPRQPSRRSMLDASSRSQSIYSISASPLDSHPFPRLDHSHLVVGKDAALLSHAKTLELYRANAKKTGDPDVIFEFASLMLTVAHETNDDDEVDPALLEPKARRRTSTMGLTRRRGSPSSSSSSIFRSNPPSTESSEPTSATSSESDLPLTKRNALFREAAQLLRKLANQGHVASQHLLGDLHASGNLNAKGKPEWDKASPLFVLAAKHGHTDAAFRAAYCCEHALGCKKDWTKAVQWLRKACADSHPEAMFRLGMAEIKGELGLANRQKEGFKWLKRAAELADTPDCHPSSIEALYELGLLHVKGIEHVVFVDTDYAAECWAKAAAAGHAQSAYLLGQCYEYGKYNCPPEEALSIHYYNIAAQQNHAEACFALTAWYLIGSVGVLPQSDTEAYLWAKRAAAAGLSKAEYAVGHFSETGRGTPKDMTEAMMWYRRAAEHGDQRAIDRLQHYPNAPLGPRSNSMVDPATPSKGIQRAPKSKSDSDCIIS